MTLPPPPRAPTPYDSLLVALPGLDGTGRLFDAFAHAWRPKPLEIIDLPNDRPMNYDELVEHVLPRLPQRGSFALLAESFSGPLAVRIAARRPRGLRGLVFAASFIRAPIPLSGLARRMAGWLPLRSMPRLTLEAALLSRGSPAGLADTIEQTVRSVPTDVLTHRLQSLLGSDERPGMAQLKLPVLCLTARDDRLVSRNAESDLGTIGYSGSMTAHRFDAPHMLLQTRPAECAQAIAAFTRYLPPVPLA